MDRLSRKTRSQCLQLGFQAVLFVCVFSLFMLCLSKYNPWLLGLSRTTAITVASFVVFYAVLVKLYGGMQLGKYKVRIVLPSVVLAVLLTDLITYFLLEIMNVNPNKNLSLVLFGEDFLPLVVAAALQTLVCFALVWSCTVLYYKINPRQRCLIVASSQEQADHVAQKLNTFKQKYRVNDVVHYECADVWDSIMENDVTFIAGVPSAEQSQFKLFCYKNHKTVCLLAELEDVILSTSEQLVIDDMPVLQIQRMEITLWQRFVKRAFDLVVGLLAFIALSPLMLASALAIRLCDKGPVFFKQRRATIGGKVFTIIKFRTMYCSRERAVSVSEHDSRITPVGRVLRRLRIDELPQLINIILGEMSFVGPRPEMLENVEKYSREVPEFVYRQQMKAGLTGLAQIDGKYNTIPKDKIILDMFYIENFSMMMDIKLMLRTLTVILKKDSTEGFRETATPSTMRMRVAPREESAEREAPQARSGIPTAS